MWLDLRDSSPARQTAILVESVCQAAITRNPWYPKRIAISYTGERRVGTEARLARRRRLEHVEVLPKLRRPNVLSLSRSRPPNPGSATRSVEQNEARKRRASERPRVGCCEELGGGIR